MNVLYAAAIFLSQCALIWACVSVSWWLWKHRRVSAPRGRSRCRAANGSGSDREINREERRAQLLYLCAHLDGAGCRRVAYVFNRWHGGWATIGKTAVWEFRREHDAEIRERIRQRKRQRPRVMRVKESWSLDLTFIRSPFGATFTVLAILDAGSRKLLRLQVLPTKCALVVLGHVLIAAGTHGLPKSLRTDNEAMFTSKLWLATLRALGIAHRRGPPCQPWRNGRIERFFGTLKPALSGMRLPTAQSLQSALRRFARWYNVFRPHRSLDGLTPEEAWCGRTMRDVWRAHDDARYRAGARHGLLGLQCAPSPDG